MTQAVRSQQPMRNEHGKFLAGHPPSSPGRPHKVVEEEELRRLRAVVSPEWDEVVRRQLEIALRGEDRTSTAAATWLAKYMLPGPEALARALEERVRAGTGMARLGDLSKLSLEELRTLKALQEKAGVVEERVVDVTPDQAEPGK